MNKQATSPRFRQIVGGILVAFLFVPAPLLFADAICPNQPLDTPYDLSGKHFWGGEIIVNDDQIINSCDEWQDFRNGLKPRNVTVDVPQSSMFLALPSVEVQGLTATLNYTGVLIINFARECWCEARHVCESDQWEMETASTSSG